MDIDTVRSIWARVVQTTYDTLGWLFFLALIAIFVGTVIAAFGSTGMSPSGGSF